MGKCYDRINARENDVHAWVTLKSRAEALLDSAGSSHLPLRGLSIAVKDNFDTADFPTEVGSPIYARTPIIPRRAAVGFAAQRRCGYSRLSCHNRVAHFQPGPPGILTIYLVPSEDIERPRGGSCGRHGVRCHRFANGRICNPARLILRCRGLRRLYWHLAEPWLASIGAIHGFDRSVRLMEPRILALRRRPSHERHGRHHRARCPGEVRVVVGV